MTDESFFSVVRLDEESIEIPIRIPLSRYPSNKANERYGNLCTQSL